MKSKKLVSLFLAIVMLVSMFAALATTAAAAGSTAMRTVCDAYRIARSGSTINIQRGTLYKDGKAQDTVYVIGLSGSDFSADPNKINGFAQLMLACSSISNKYLKELKAKVQAQIPTGSKLILVGHSMGGMVAQQFMADKTMKSNYQILNVVAMGSPYIITAGGKEGTLRRMADRADVAPYCSILGLCNAFSGNPSYESSGYVAGDAHNKSYAAPCWEKYDCLGVKGGRSEVIFQ